MQVSETHDVEVQHLLHQLLQLARSQSPLPCVCLRAVKTHQVKRFEAEVATFSFPLQGTFSYRENGDWVTVHPGEMLVVPNARSLDIEYAPCKDSGEFVALSLSLAEEQLEAARLLLADPAQQDIGDVVAVSVGDLLAPLKRWVKAMTGGIRPLSLHAMVEVVLMLYAMGCRGLLRARDPGLAMKIRRMVAKDPAHLWHAAEIEQQLGFSGATLRRRLAAESTSLRAIIIEARVAEALRLLMSSDLPVKTVAGRVGYSSVTSFSRQFSDRYGIEPSGFR
ncbi:helix-turn-helix transcriptional regulator [Pantoea coffeiphila]|uniref:AraC family transcriptional regulator n=1 Tax=Pantoea coffeiphila TaxID=1465635 RepID=A0A2S9I9J7_9GAMM|nr:AraC family transcriptional regulator [Pantoea coffeiphila]PRD14455.1 AraC family transcriptional regulator [Pantoea coffeiphila]